MGYARGPSRSSYPESIQITLDGFIRRGGQIVTWREWRREIEQKDFEDLAAINPNSSAIGVCSDPVAEISVVCRNGRGHYRMEEFSLQSPAETEEDGPPRNAEKERGRQCQTKFDRRAKSQARIEAIVKRRSRCKEHAEVLPLYHRVVD